MSALFLDIINMSISASYIVLAVLLLRAIIKKAPKWITVISWGIVALRLICPLSVESVLSLIPSPETVSPDIMTDENPTIDSGIPILNGTINPIIEESFTPRPGDSINPLQVWIPVLATIWLIGIAVLIIYTFVSYLRIKRKIQTAVLVCDNIYQSENIASPFVFGVIKPNIYIPFNISERDIRYVISHESAHIKRGDHLWKSLGFALLMLHWFNPLIWIGYIMLCRDIELACDEKVIKTLDRNERANYSEALLGCSVRRRTISFCPLAFGEVGVGARIKSVLNYKKHAFWIVIAAIIICVFFAVCFLTNPPAENKNNNGICTSDEIFTDLSGIYVTVKSIDTNEGAHTVLNLEWHNDTHRNVTYGEEYSIEYKMGSTWIDAAFEEVNFLAVGYSLEPYRNENKSYSTQRFDVTRVGRYRLTVPFWIQEDDGYIKHKTWIEFDISTVSPAALFEKYPQFYGLNSEEGLTVYVSQFNRANYSCYLVSNAECETIDGRPIFSTGVSISNMRTILSTYNISRDEITIEPMQNLLSSYYYEINDEYRKNLEVKFWSDNTK